MIQPRHFNHPKSYALLDWTNLKSFPTVDEDAFQSITINGKTSKPWKLKKKKTNKVATKSKPSVRWSSKRTSKIMNNSKYIYKI